MKTINIPGFTAEDSLYKSRTQYNMSATRFLAAKADIRPQRPDVCGPLENDIQEALNDAGYAAAANYWWGFNLAMDDVNSMRRKHARWKCGS
jgi:hypothetical protein